MYLGRFITLTWIQQHLPMLLTAVISCNTQYTQLTAMMPLLEKRAVRGHPTTWSALASYVVDVAQIYKGENQLSVVQLLRLR